MTPERGARPYATHDNGRWSASLRQTPSAPCKCGHYYIEHFRGGQSCGVPGCKCRSFRKAAGGE